MRRSTLPATTRVACDDPRLIADAVAPSDARPSVHNCDLQAVSGWFGPICTHPARPSVHGWNQRIARLRAILRAIPRLARPASLRGHRGELA